MSNSIKYKQALTRAMQICSRQERCRWDIEQKLKEWELSPEDIDKIITCLVQQSFINELRYANSFANDKLKFNKWGRYKIRHTLLQKHIPDNIIDEVLGTIDNNEYIALVKKEILKKFSSLKRGEPANKKSKLIRFALSKGFEPEIIYPIINSVLPG